MMKKKTYDIADSNIALLGSKLEKDCKFESAATETAWKNAGKKVGMQIWRIEQFKVKSWPEPQYGQFYSGDSYIILNTYASKENPDKLMYDLHFWLGCSTTQDEAGTAAYKTVELDTLLGDKPVQHREIEGCESSLFCSYFANTGGGIRLLEGGVESGFNHVTAETYKPRLLHLKGKKNVRVVEVPLTADSLNSGDTFILDNGLSLYQWQGKNAGIKEKSRAAQTARALDDERKGQASVTVLDEGDSDADFWALLGGEKAIQSGGGDDEAWEKGDEKSLWQLSDAGGKLEFNKVGSGSRVNRSQLDTKDVFILDVGNELFVWVGAGSSRGERKQAMFQASEYLANNSRPKFLPITRLLEGGENDYFESLFSVSARITKAAPTALGSTCEQGEGCYLTYETASNGTYFLNWSRTKVNGALAYMKPKKPVAGFKFTTQGGKDELTRGTDNTPINAYQGWCNYLKMAREYEATVTLTTDVVAVLVHDGTTIDTKEPGSTFDFNSIADVAVGIFPKAMEVFTGAQKTGRDHFLSQSQSAGAALVLPKRK